MNDKKENKKPRVMTFAVLMFCGGCIPPISVETNTPVNVYVDSKAGSDSDSQSAPVSNVSPSITTSSQSAAESTASVTSIHDVYYCNAKDGKAIVRGNLKGNYVLHELTCSGIVTMGLGKEEGPTHIEDTYYVENHALSK